MLCPAIAACGCRFMPAGLITRVEWRAIEIAVWRPS